MLPTAARMVSISIAMIAVRHSAIVRPLSQAWIAADALLPGLSVQSIQPVRTKNSGGARPLRHSSSQG